MRTWGTLLALVAWGCGPSAEKFNADYVEQHCSHIVLCGDINPYTSYDECLDSVAESLPTESDACVFDKKLAKACLDEIEAATCDNLLSLPSCEGAFTGECGTVTTPTEDTGPDYVFDLFEQTQISPVDIVWVLDHGYDRTGELATSLEPMWEVLLLADPSWQMGVLDATLTNSSFALLKAQWSTWPPPSNAFNINGNGSTPRMREVVYSAFELRGTSTQNKDFLRSGASLYVLYVTDDQDGSDNEAISERGYADFLTSISTDARVGVITESDQRNYWEGQVLGGGSVYTNDDAVRSALLEAVGLETSFTLTRKPLDPPQTAEVIYRNHADTYTLDRDYSYDGQSRTLTFKRVIPPPGSTVRVFYEEKVPEATTGE